MTQITKVKRSGFGCSSFTGLLIPAICAFAMALAAPSGAASGSYTLSSRLIGTTTTIRATHATGAFRGTLKLAGKDSSFTWTLMFRHLSGRALHAGIYFGKTSKPSQLAMLLCNKCVSGANSYYQGSYVASPRFVRKILHGHAYVVIQTKKHPKGEIRGRIKATGA